jgi:hypothetical protein
VESSTQLVDGVCHSIFFGGGRQASVQYLDPERHRSSD